MKAKFTFVWLALALAAALVLPAGGAAGSMVPAATTAGTGTGIGDEVIAYFNFEQGLKPWIPMTDSPYHKFVLTQQSGSNGCLDIGNHYAQLVSLPKPALDPALAPPFKNATWALADFAVGGTGVRKVTVQWSAKWSPECCSEQPDYLKDHPAVYVGTNPPAKGLEFAIPKGQMTWSWQTFKYQAYVQLPPHVPGVTTPVYIAVGWDNVGDSMDLDCLSVAITHLPTNK